MPGVNRLDTAFSAHFSLKRRDALKHYWRNAITWALRARARRRGIEIADGWMHRTRARPLQCTERRSRSRGFFRRRCVGVADGVTQLVGRPGGMPMDENRVLLTGENPFIRLNADGPDAEATTNASFWRILYW